MGELAVHRVHSRETSGGVDGAAFAALLGLGGLLCGDLGSIERVKARLQHGGSGLRLGEAVERPVGVQAAESNLGDFDIQAAGVAHTKDFNAFPNQ